ncbi:hypothetical protein D3C76_1161480 [compost metagenome]
MPPRSRWLSSSWRKGELSSSATGTGAPRPSRLWPTKRLAWRITPGQSLRNTRRLWKPSQKSVRRRMVSPKCRAPLARVTALMAPAEVPTMTGNGLAAPNGSKSAMPANTPT